MKIKDGFNNMESAIEIRPQANGHIELWIFQPGLKDEKAKETLSYMTIDELHKLFQEVQAAGRDLFSV